MVHYPNPKYIKKTQVRGTAPYKFSAADKRADQVATIATCLRCAQNIAKQKKDCDMPKHRRCDHCVAGNRGGCTAVSFEGVRCSCALADLHRLFRR